MRVSRGLKYWIASAVWAAFISVLSTDSFSSEHTSRIVLPALRWLFPHASADVLEIMHAVIRKTAHLTEYFILSTLLFLAQRGDSRGWKLRWAIWLSLYAQVTLRSMSSTNRSSPAVRPRRGMR